MHSLKGKVAQGLSASKPKKSIHQITIKKDTVNSFRATEQQEGIMKNITVVNLTVWCPGLFLKLADNCSHQGCFGVPGGRVGARCILLS